MQSILVLTTVLMGVWMLAKSCYSYYMYIAVMIYCCWVITQFDSNVPIIGIALTLIAILRTDGSNLL